MHVFHNESDTDSDMYINVMMAELSVYYEA